MNMMNNIKSSLLVLTLATLSASAFASNERRELTPDERLIFAVKGVKPAYVFAATLVNPLVGLMAAAYEPGESYSDLYRIDEQLALGANINYQEAYGYTALIYAAYKGYPHIAAHLVQKGANVQIKERKGYNAYTMAKYYVDDYTSDLARNEVKPYDNNFGPADKERMRRYYQEHITRYQQIVDLLEGLTLNKEMPPSYWF